MVSSRNSFQGVVERVFLRSLLTEMVEGLEKRLMHRVEQEMKASIRISILLSSCPAVLLSSCPAVQRVGHPS